MLLLLLVPSQSFSGLLGLSRKLEHLYRNVVLSNTGLSIEQANILVEMEGTVSFGPPGASRHDDDGFVVFGALAERLTLTKPALSRRFAEMKELGWVEDCPVVRAGLPEEKRPHGNAHLVRITARGRKKITPVVKRMIKLGPELFEGMTLKQREVYCEVFDLLRQRVEQRLRRK